MTQRSVGTAKVMILRGLDEIVVKSGRGLTKDPNPNSSSHDCPRHFGFMIKTCLENVDLDSVLLPAENPSVRGVNAL